MDAMLQHVQRALHALQVPRFTPLLVGVSAGVDSTVLAHVLHRLGHPLHLAHMNHQLRGGASDADLAFVTALGKELGAQVHLRPGPPQGEMEATGASKLMAARSLRYRFYEDCLTAHSIAHCALAHHADDQAETVLLHLLRGGDERVLGGIPARRGPYIRPLLGITKARLTAWALTQGVDWREDTSNQRTEPLRNHLRHKVMPLLTELHPHAPQQLVRRAAQSQRQRTVLVELLLAKHAHRYDPQRRTLCFRRDEICDESLRLYLRHVLATELGMPGPQLDEAEALMEADGGKVLIYKEVSFLRVQDGLTWSVKR